MTAGVNLKRQDAIATLEIDGRTHLNLLGPDVFRELAERVEECGRDESLRAIILRGASDRFVWTMSVLLGCDMVLTAIFAVIVPLARMLNEVALIAAYATFMIWSVTVFGFILSRSLKSHMAIGVGLAFSMMLISTGLASLASAG